MKIEKPAIKADIVGYTVTFDLDEAQMEYYCKLLLEYTAKQFPKLNKKKLEEVAVKIVREDYKNLSQGFLNTESLRDFLLSGKIPLKRTCKYLPWFSCRTISFLDYNFLPYQNIRRMLEFGGGNSSIWFAKRVNQVITVERNKLWREAIEKWMKEEKLENLRVVDTIQKIQATTALDFIMIDSNTRQQCVEDVMWADRTNTRLIGVDNINNFIDTEGNFGEGSGRYAHLWLLENGWRILKEFKDTCFYMRKK